MLTRLSTVVLYVLLVLTATAIAKLNPEASLTSRQNLIMLTS
jgi:hypothetical protein